MLQPLVFLARHESSCCLAKATVLCSSALQASGVLGLQLGSQQPLVCAMISGELVLVESGHNALFDVLVLVLHHCHQKGSMLGARSLAQLNLGEIVQPAAPAFLAAAVKLKRRFLW